MDPKPYGKAVTARSGLGRNVPFRLNKNKVDNKGGIKKTKKLKPISKNNKSSTINVSDLRKKKESSRESTSSPAILELANKSRRPNNFKKKKPKDAWATPTKEPLKSINVNVMSDSIPSFGDEGADFIPDDIDYGLERNFDQDFEEDDDIEDESPSSLATPFQDDPVMNTPQQDDIPEVDDNPSTGVFDLTSVNIVEKHAELSDQKKVLSKLKSDLEQKQKVQLTIREELKSYLDMLRGTDGKGSSVISFPDHFDDVVDMMSKGRTQLPDDLIHEYISAANISDQELMDIETMDDDEDVSDTTSVASELSTVPKKKATLLHIRKLELMLSRQEKDHDEVSKEVEEIIKHDTLLSEILENRKIPLRELLLNEQKYIDEYLAEKKADKERLSEEMGDQVDSKTLNKSRLNELSTSNRHKQLENAHDVPSTTKAKDDDDEEVKESPASPPPIFITASQRQRIDEILAEDTSVDDNPFSEMENEVSEIDKKIDQLKPGLFKNANVSEIQADDKDPFTADSEELLKIEEAIADVYSKAMENRKKKIDESTMKKLIREARIDASKN
mmetsp:Transcript_4707/g.6978  ORF Transcript_4707/g.6978 Transcript_4707/m.6978 type:complete len:560 (+) Transcript_4707:15-1694(+)